MEGRIGLRFTGPGLGGSRGLLALTFQGQEGPIGAVTGIN